MTSTNILAQLQLENRANLSSSGHQKSAFVSRKTSDNLILKCFYEGEVAARLYWYKQPLGQKPMLISYSYIYEKNNTFFGEFKNNPRFSLDTENGKNHLMIRELQISDSATYYCMTSYLYRLTFSESITVIVNDAESNVQAVVQQSASEIIQQGDSVTLNCTVHTGTCDEEHSVYWFQNSDESHSQSHPGVIYTHWGGNDQCEKEAKTQTHTCVYNLPMNNLNLSHAGTYYCAVASCGHILFGNGTKLDFEHNVFWSGTFAVTSILSVLLAFSVIINIRNFCCSCRISSKSPQSRCNGDGFQEAERLYFPSSTVNLHNRSRSQKDRTWSECVYYSVKQ
uniref:Ig-like domain-containing protein n=1 Tax=Pundamilia nyererei TaxID=303518 RepID=A0A3B4GHX2_9CICH